MLRQVLGYYEHHLNNQQHESFTTERHSCYINKTVLDIAEVMRWNSSVVNSTHTKPPVDVQSVLEYRIRKKKTMINLLLICFRILEVPLMLLLRA